jgi:hypothetical protein
MSMNHPGTLLLLIGLALVGIGLLWMASGSLPWLGRLPGDIAIEGKNTRFYFPIMTCLLLSLLLSGVFWVVRRFWGP